MIRVYFSNRIANCFIKDSYDDMLKTHIFQIDCKGSPATVDISRAFIDAHSPAEILKTLIQLRPESYIQGKNAGHIVITNDGIKVKSNL